MSSFDKNEFNKVYIFFFLIIYLIFSAVLICHFVLSSESWDNHIVPFVILFCIFLAFVCIKKIFPYRVRIFLLVIFSFIQLFYYGIHETAFRTDFHMVLGMFLFLVLFTNEFFLIVLGVLMYFVLLGIHTYESGSMKYLEYFFTPMYILPIFSVFSFFMIKSRKNFVSKYYNELEYYKRRCTESEEYLHDISHVLRLKLNTISCVSGIMVEKNPALKNDEDLILVKNDIRRLSNSIDDIMNFSEISSDKFEKSVASYSFADMIKNIVSNVSDYSSGRNLDLYLDISPDIPSVLIGDELKIFSIINRLVEDSIKFTPRGTVYLSISARKESYGVNLNICVEDNSEGLSQRHIDRIFRLRNSHNNSEDHDNKKIGIQELNLMVIRKLVFVFNGFMSVELNKDAGKTVRLSIPQKVGNGRGWLDIYDLSDISPYVFMKHDKFSVQRFFIMGKKFMDNIFSSLNLAPKYVSSTVDINNAISDNSITHLFISGYEYNWRKEYFDSVMDDVQIVLIVDDADTNKYDERIKVIKVPFTVYDLHSLLIGKKERKKNANKYDKFFHGKKIMLVENDPISRNVISRLLKIMGADVDALASAEDIVNMCSEKKYDIIFIAYLLDNYHVEDVIKQIHDFGESMNRKTPVIAIVSSVHSNMHDKIKKKGFVSYVPMPITRKSILKCCSDVLAKDDIHVYEPHSYSTKNILKKSDEKVEKVPIIVTSESVCNLSLSQIEADGIQIIPYHITNSDGYRFDDFRETDCNFIFGTDFPDTYKIKTCFPTVEEYRDFFSGLLKKAEKIIHISSMGCLSTAMESAKEFSGVTVVGSGSFSFFMGNIVQTAARAANAGYDVEHILGLIETLKKRIRMSFVLGDIQNAEPLNNLLHNFYGICRAVGLSPVVTIKNKIPVIKNILLQDWKDVYKDYVYMVLMDRNISNELLVIGYAGLTWWQLDQIVDEVKRYRRFSNIVTYKFSSSVAIRLGDGAFGFMYYINDNKNRPNWR